MNKIVLILSLLVLWGCGGGTSEEKEAGKKIFSYNQPNPISSLDPAFARSQNNIWAVHHLFNTLVSLDDALETQASLAKSWDISDDGLTYTFSLRTDVYFHDDPAFSNGKGRLLVAEDVVYSFSRLIDPNLNAPGSWVFLDKIDKNQAFSAPNDSTFVLRLERPFRPMLQMLTMQYCSVIPKEAVLKYGSDFRRHPVGTGPFSLVNWKENQALALAKNTNYFESSGDRPYPFLDGVYVSFIGDRKTAYLEMTKGKLDYFSGLESSYVNDLLSPDGSLQPHHTEQLRLSKVPYLNMEYIGINLDMVKEGNSALQHKKVRQALNYAIDRAQMIKTLRNNVGQAATAGFVCPGLPSFDATVVGGYSYQPDKAQALLNEAGYTDRSTIPPITLYTNKDYLDICTFVAKSWENMGVQSTIEVVEASTLRQLMSDGKISMFRASWIADYPDSESFLSVFYGQQPAPPNYTRFSNKTFDTYYEQALSENEDAKRYALYHKMDRILVEEAPVIFLFYDETAVFSQRGVRNLSANAINLLNLKAVDKD